MSHDFILFLIMLMQVHRISQLVLKRERDFINTVGVSCMETPAKVYLKSRNCYCKLPIRELHDDYMMYLQIIILHVKQYPQFFLG